MEYDFSKKHMLYDEYLLSRLKLLLILLIGQNVGDTFNADK